MADIRANAARARSALVEVAQRSDDMRTRARAEALVTEIDDWMATGVTRVDASDDDATSDHIEQSVRAMSDALGASSFDDVLHHGMALVGSLPGNPQSGQKPPRRP